MAYPNISVSSSIPASHSSIYLASERRKKKTTEHRRQKQPWSCEFSRLKSIPWQMATFVSFRTRNRHVKFVQLLSTKAKSDGGETRRRRPHEMHFDSGGQGNTSDCICCLPECISSIKTKVASLLAYGGADLSQLFESCFALYSPPV